MTNYPWEIGDIGDILHIPGAHSGQRAELGKIWMKFYLDSYTPEEISDTMNFYLTTNNNVSMIQTGHSNGRATEDEQKILANLIFYMNQLLFEKASLRDASAQDIAAPEITAHTFAHGAETITISGIDHGSIYYYYAESYDKDDTTETGLIHTSNIDDVTVETGIKQYKYLFSANPTEDAKAIDVSGKAINPDTPISYAEHRGQYLHVMAIDGAGNLSIPSSIYIPEASTISIMGKKRLSDNTKVFDNEFSFTLYDEKMNDIANASNTESGEFSFDNIVCDNLSAIKDTQGNDETASPRSSYTKTFYAREEAGSDDTVIYDDSLYRIQAILVDDDSNGVLEISSILYEKVDPNTLDVLSREDDLVFTNTRLITMPETGANPWSRIAIAISGGIMIIASLSMICRIRK